MTKNEALKKLNEDFKKHFKQGYFLIGYLDEDGSMRAGGAISEIKLADVALSCAVVLGDFNSKIKGQAPEQPEKK